MTSRFALVSEKEILSINEEDVTKNKKMATKFDDVTVFKMESCLISPTSINR